jgi:succinoglycan biosynthesis protein ExoW
MIWPFSSKGEAWNQDRHDPLPLRDRQQRSAMTVKGHSDPTASGERDPESAMAIRAAVVVPFYQREPGLLRRTVESICNQDCLSDTQLQVMVVDDESPHPAADDLRGLTLPPGVQLIIINQSNGGPAAARNTALDALGEDIDYVAFLDSDDVWEPRHLSRAVSALKAGVDLYFSDHLREDLFGSYLTRWQAMLDQMTEPASTDPDLLLVEAQKRGLFMLQLVPATSSVVYRWKPNAGLRFKPHLRTAGEDQVFLLEIVASGAVVGISKILSVRCGKGVNIYFDSLSWDQPACLSRLADRLGSFRLLRHIVADHDSDALAFIADKTVLLERLVAVVAARGLARRISGFALRVQQVARSQPHFWWWAPKRLVEVGFLKMAGQFQPGNE